VSGQIRSRRGGDKLTGERPLQGVTPDSLLALHDAGYRAVLERLGAGLVLDVGCGEGFESVRLAGADREVVGVDYSPAAVAAAGTRWRGKGLHVLAADATRLACATGVFDWACSSHIVEHFAEPDGHLGEMARALAPHGTAFILTPNAPADFENPFHIRLFGPDDLRAALERHFARVWVGGLDATASVKADFAARRARGTRMLRFDVFDLRHRLPRSWYIAAYTRLLPLAYRLLARDDSGGTTGITADDFFVTDVVDDTTLVLFAVASEPRRAAPATGEAVVAEVPASSAARRS